MAGRVFSPRRLQSSRHRRGFSQSDLAYEIRRYLHDSVDARPDQGTINRWESGRNAPHADVLPAIAGALGITIDDLYEEEEGGDEDEEEDAEAALRRRRQELVGAMKTIAQEVERLEEVPVR